MRTAFRWAIPWVLLCLAPVCLGQAEPTVEETIDEPTATETAETAEITPVEDRALRGVLDDGGFQTGLPGHDAQAGSADAAERRRDRRWDFVRGLPASWTTGLTWLVLAAGVVILLWLFLQGLRRPAEGLGGGADTAESEGSPGSVALETAAPAAARPAKAPDWSDAEELARRGEWAEALRLLLALVLGSLRPRRVLPVSAATTGRELLGRASWSEEEERDLKRLVTTTERAVFAGRSVTAQDYADARSAAQRLAGRADGAAP